MAQYAYKKDAGLDAKGPQDSQLADMAIFVEEIASTIYLGPTLATEFRLSANYHLYLPWLYTVLQRLEQRTSIRKPQDQIFASKGYIHRKLNELLGAISVSRRTREHIEGSAYTAINQRQGLDLGCKVTTSPRLTPQFLHALSNFVEETKGTIAVNAFRPEKYTDPKGGRLFNLLLVYSFQAHHIRVDTPTFGRILVNAGLERRATAQRGENLSKILETL